MVDEIDLIDDSEFGVSAVEFTRQTARDLYRAGFGSTDLIARWDRIRSEIRFEDIVSELHGTNTLVISCPFHGRDSRPSFFLYKRSNDGYCFGCPQGEQYYDSVRFAAAKLACSRAQAISWIEKHYDLPTLEGVEDDEDEDDETEDGTRIVQLTFNELCEPFIALAAASFTQDPDPDLAREYIELFFDSVPERNANLKSEEELRKARTLGRVLGMEALEAIKKGIQI
jgi:hypothetical protein